MKGKINDLGDLEIFRNSKFKMQKCNFAEMDGLGSQFCGDNCPLFGEPESVDVVCVSIEICQGRTLLFGEFTDERVKGEDRNCGARLDKLLIDLHKRVDNYCLSHNDIDGENVKKMIGCMLMAEDKGVTDNG